MLQHEGLGLTRRITHRLTPKFLFTAVGAWPSALYGVPRRYLLDTSGERKVRSRIRLRLKQLRLSQAALAEAIGVAHAMVSSVLSGWKRLPPAWLPQLTGALNMNEAELLRGVQWGLRRRSARGAVVRRPLSRRRETPQDRALRARLRGLLSSRNLTQKQVADAIGIAGPMVSKVLAGVRALPPAWLTPLASLLDLTIPQILKGTAWTRHKRGPVRKNRHHASPAAR
jgi:transcriptional regulator with XRE-family HTH domain